MSGGVWIVKGSDPVLVADGLRSQVDALLAGLDRELALESFDLAEHELGAVIDAAQTPPFLSDRRVVAVRNLAGLESKAKDALAPLVAYLEDPSPTTTLVVEVVGALPPSLSKAAKASGANIVETDAPNRARDRMAWVGEQAVLAGVRLDNAAIDLVVTTCGDDLARVGSVLELLASTFGEAKRLGPNEVAPFLGDAGGVPPWELTDAIDRGDAPAALANLRRLTGSGRHPLQLMAILQTHYLRMVRLDGSEVTSEHDAAGLLGMKGFGARKVLDQSRRLGPANLRRAVALLAAADLDLRGETGVAEDAVMDVLVARLARLSGSARRR